jgi:NAD(P)-dependent dehydrogenase (short-subunit alcohol dehydrogenase family)
MKKGNIIITGINRGLGKELFQLFISEGYTVYGILRNTLEAENLKDKLPKNGKIILADLSLDESITTIQKAIGEQPVGLLINNAGIGGLSYLIEEIESNEINKLFNIHCLGVFRTVKAVKANLLKAKEPIVLNLNSRLGSMTRQSSGTYNDITVSYSYRIAKAAQNMLTLCLRKEFKENIKFISIHPGKMKTDIAQIDADIEPKVTAKKVLKYFENKTFKEENGIIELDKQVIEW